MRAVVSVASVALNAASLAGDVFLAPFGAGAAHVV